MQDLKVLLEGIAHMAALYDGVAVEGYQEFRKIGRNFGVQFGVQYMNSS